MFPEILFLTNEEFQEMVPGDKLRVAKFQEKENRILVNIDNPSTGSGGFWEKLMAVIHDLGHALSYNIAKQNSERQGISREYEVTGLEHDYIYEGTADDFRFVVFKALAELYSEEDSEKHYGFDLINIFTESMNWWLAIRNRTEMHKIYFYGGLLVRSLRELATPEFWKDEILPYLCELSTLKKSQFSLYEITRHFFEHYRIYP
jgi:hypothetical protein